MQITYLDCGTEKLISYHRHDYKAKEIDGVLYMIDGGQFDYIRVSGGVVKRAEISELIEFIRNDFKWAVYVTKDGKWGKPVYTLISELTVSQLYHAIANVAVGIQLNYTIESKTEKEISLHSNLIISIFVEELNFRKNVEVSE